MVTAPISYPRRTIRDAHLTVDSTGLHVPPELDGHDCFSIIAYPSDGGKGHISAVLDCEAPKHDVNFGRSVLAERNHGIRATRSLVIAETERPLGECIPYDVVLDMLKSLPDLTALSIGYDEVQVWATKKAQERRLDGFPHLKLESYELSCVFADCELPIIFSQHTLRWLTVTPGALHPMTTDKMNQFLSAFREILPHLSGLTLSCHRLRVPRDPDSGWAAFSAGAAVQILEEMQSKLRLHELNIEDDEAGLNKNGLLRRLFTACLPGVRDLSISPRLGRSSWGIRDVITLIDSLPHPWARADTGVRSCLQFVRIVVKGRRLNGIDVLKMWVTKNYFLLWAKKSRIRGEFEFVPYS